MIAVPRRYSEIVNVFCKSKSGLLLAAGRSYASFVLIL